MNNETKAIELKKELTEYLSRVALKRDRQAFAALYDHFAPLVRSYSLAREPGAELVADELAQEVMLRIWLKAQTFNGSLASINTWVFTLARNCRIDYLRRNSRHQSDIDPALVFDDIEDPGVGPFQQVHQQRLRERIQAGFKKLPNEQAQVLSKVYLEGKSHQVACEELNLPLGTVKSRIRLALKKMEVLLEK